MRPTDCPRPRSLEEKVVVNLRRVSHCVLIKTGRKRLSTEDLAGGEEPAPAKKLRRPKTYIPSLRSGAYALILALSATPEESLNSLTKKQVIDLAQPHCDSSFTVPSEAGKFYTAWNSMKTLVDKDLVQEKGRPLRKYALTDEGWDVARKIKAAQGDDAGSKAATKVSTAPPNSNHGAPETSTVGGRAFDIFQDIEDDENMVPHIQPVKFRESSPKVLEPKPNPAGQRLGGEYTDKFGTSKKSRERDKPVPSLTNIVDLLSSPEPDIPCATSSFGQDSKSFTLAPNPKSSAKAPKTSLSNHPHPPPISTIRSSDQVPKEAQRTQTTAKQHKTASLPTFTPIELPPSTFTIRLVLDNREVRTASDRTYIHDALANLGTPPIVRPLELGDFFWVATLTPEGQRLLAHNSEEGTEIALDWIVERKRLDDLVGSITDGRFAEQKFRLRKSGVRNVIYLIEEFSLSSERLTKFHDAIQSAIASTQVVNGYFVKRTQKLDETIRYLARMTRMLKSRYESRSLFVIPTSVLTPTTYLPLLNHLRTDPAHRDRTYNITYPSFASLSSKSDTLTLRDVFLKMLMCTRGISGDKALAIQKIWDTPRAFIEAFEGCKTQKERDTMIETKLGGMVGRAKIKGILGAKVAAVWGEA